MGKISATTDKTFEEEVLKGDNHVLVDFWASWCAPCHMMTPVLEQVAEKYANLNVKKLNVDENPKFASKFNIRSIPTLILFKEGKPISQYIGYVPLETLSKELEKSL